jgi:glycosyltransferase involved in cell wall biosynthesis
MISSTKSTLTVVIPALNEEEAIAATLTRCLEVSNSLCSSVGLQNIEWIVVSDGSTDKTVEIARSFEAVKVIVLPTNQGYGAAIQIGFEVGTGDLLAFLDADGTCDPTCFEKMCSQILEEGAEVVLGSRMGPDSQMPRIRRIGNWLYAVLLGFLTGRSVTDAASGMRVLTRDAWHQLQPLPSGLHFTPAMSAKALVTHMRIVEIPIPYATRIGESKLHVVRDGFRFLSAILGGLLSVRPDRFLGMILLVCMILTIGIAAFPIEHYLRNKSLEEWMIHRFIACLVLSYAGFTTLAAIAVSHRLASLGPQRKPTDSFYASLAAKLFTPFPLCIWGGLGTFVSLYLIRDGLLEYITKRTVDLHWSRLIVAAFLLSIVFQGFITAVLVGVIHMWVDAERTKLRPKGG